MRRGVPAISLLTAGLLEASPPADASGGPSDGDGHTDIVLALTMPGHAGRTYLNDGKGRFRDCGQIIGHQWVQSVALGDLNGDGSLGIFLACGSPHSGTPSEVWLNNGTLSVGALR